MTSNWSGGIICRSATTQPRAMPHPIESPASADLPRLLEVWEAAVRASHDFLQESDIQTLKPLLTSQYFPHLQLSCIRADNGRVAGFLGYADGKVEMLFVDPRATARASASACWRMRSLAWAHGRSTSTSRTPGPWLSTSAKVFRWNAARRWTAAAGRFRSCTCG